MAETVELQGMAWDHPRGYDCLVAASAQYADETGVRIAWKKRSLQAFADQPIEALAAEYDFIVLDHPHVGQIAKSRALLELPMPQDAAEISMGGSLESYRYDGALWAYPVDAACQMAVRRPDLDAPFARRWEDFLGPDAARFHALTPLLPVDAFDMLMTLVAGRGEVMVPYSPREFVSADNGLAALGVLKALYRLGPAEATGFNPIRVLEVMAEEDDFAASPCLFGYVNYARPGFRRHRLLYEDLPLFEGQETRRGILGGAGLGISRRTDHPEAALDFARWIASQRVQSSVYLENQGQPAHRRTWMEKRHDPEYAGFFDGAFDTMEAAWTRPRDEWFLHYVDEVCAIMPDYFLKDRDPQAFLDQLNALYRHYMPKARE